ncbi:MAG TPA: hypothetical protein VER35_01590 [Candidatus Limnocylindrales bacterium]|nr:hypothetical protein [Candidatus Limnocylindrales bacterium]
MHKKKTVVGFTYDGVIQLPNTYLSSSLVRSCASFSLMNFRATHMSSRVLPEVLKILNIMGRALSIQTGSVNNDARMNKMKIKNISFEFIKKRNCRPEKRQLRNLRAQNN